MLGTLPVARQSLIGSKRPIVGLNGGCYVEWPKSLRARSGGMGEPGGSQGEHHDRHHVRRFVMKVLLTGGEGYIGTVLGPELLNDGHEVAVYDTGFHRVGWLYDGIEAAPRWSRLDTRLTEAKDLEGFDAIVHLADLSNDPVGELNPDITYQINALMSDPDEQALNTKGPYLVTRRLTTTIANADDTFFVAVNVGNYTLQMTPGGKAVLTWDTKTPGARGLEPTKDPSARVTQTYTVT